LAFAVAVRVERSRALHRRDRRKNHEFANCDRSSVLAETNEPHLKMDSFAIDCLRSLADVARAI